jgi:hypothetical protein
MIVHFPKGSLGYATLAVTLSASCWIDFASRLRRLGDAWKTGPVASLALNFGRNPFHPIPQNKSEAHLCR